MYRMLSHVKYLVVRKEAKGDWGKLRNEERRDFLSPIISVIKWRRVRWVGHVERMGEKIIAYRMVVGKRTGLGGPGRL
jgi:hypothetical protein